MKATAVQRALDSEYVKPLTVENFLSLCESSSIIFRKGATYFNLLHWARPDLARECRFNTLIDPFYDDSKIPQFIEWLRSVWVSEEKSN